MYTRWATRYTGLLFEVFSKRKDEQMSKFSKQYGTTQRTGKGPLTSTTTTVNHGGATAFARDAKSDLFLLGVMNFVGEDTYYESAGERDSRFRDLVHKVTREDPDWVARFIPWLRNEANMRSASVVAACEYVSAGGPNARQVIASAISRADEPAEVLAYWKGVVQKPIPSSVKRGVNDALARVWNEYSVAKYDGNSKNFRMGDVVQLTHPSAKRQLRGGDEDTVYGREALYKYVLDARYGETPDVSRLPMLALRRQINAGEITRDELLADPELMKRAGMTWESLSGLGPMDAAAWEAVIPNMGYMALLRNLRNFEQAGISAETTQRIIARLSSEEEVAKSRQLPFRFWSAYKNVNGLQWAYALEQALAHSLKNVPELGGKTLVLTDTSGSMQQTQTRNSTITPLETAAVFAAALALKGETVDFYGFADGVDKIDVSRGGSVLKIVERINSRCGKVGYGTNVPGAMGQWDGHDRVVLISDMQTLGRYERSNLTVSPRGYGRYGYERQVNVRNHSIPERVPVFGFNLGAYGNTQIGNTNEYELGGLTDHTFKLIPLLERRGTGTYPF